MTTVITLRLTESELSILDWLVARRQQASRSDTIRRLLSEAAVNSDIRLAELHQANAERDQHPPRRSAAAISRQLPPLRPRGRSA